MALVARERGDVERAFSLFEQGAQLAYAQREAAAFVTVQLNVAATAQEVEQRPRGLAALASIVGLIERAGPQERDSYFRLRRELEQATAGQPRRSNQI
jgi:nitrate reductase assembly molybdenum cofactor insertion protein NarJ